MTADGRRQGAGPTDDGIVELELVFASFRQFQAEFPANVSHEGLFIPRPDPLPPSAVVRFRVKLPDGFVLLEGVGVVLWTREEDSGPGQPAGMALRFASLGPQSQELIDKLVDTLVAEGGRPFDLEQAGGGEDLVPTDALAPQPHPRPVQAEVAPPKTSTPSGPPRPAAQEAVRLKVRAGSEPVAGTPFADRAPGSAAAAGQPTAKPGPAQPPPLAQPPLPAQPPAPPPPSRPSPDQGKREEAAGQAARPPAELESVQFEIVFESPEVGEPGLPALSLEPRQLGEESCGEETTGKVEATREEGETVQPAAPPPAEVAEHVSLELDLEPTPVQRKARPAEFPAPGRLATSPGGTQSDQPIARSSSGSGEAEAAQGAASAAPAPAPHERRRPASRFLPPAETPTPAKPARNEEGSENIDDLVQALGPGAEPAGSVPPRSVLPETRPPQPQRRPGPPPSAPARGFDVSLFKDLDTEPDSTPRAHGAGVAPDVTILPQDEVPRRPRRVLPWFGPTAFVVVAALAAAGFLLRDRIAALVIPETPTGTPAARGGSGPAGPSLASPTTASPSPPSGGSEPTEVPVVVPVVQPTPVPAPESSTPATRVEDITWTSGVDGTVVSIRGNGVFRDELVGVGAMDNPPRVLVRLRRIAEKYPRYELKVGSPELAQIRVGHHPEMQPPALYVVLDLTGSQVKVTATEVRGAEVRVVLARR